MPDKIRRRGHKADNIRCNCQERSDIRCRANERRKRHRLRRIETSRAGKAIARREDEHVLSQREDSEGRLPPTSEPEEKEKSPTLRERGGLDAAMYGRWRAKGGREAMRGEMDGLAGIFLDVFSADLETATAHTDGLRVIQGDSLNERHSILFFRIHCSVLHII